MKTTKSLFALLLGALAVSFTACKTEEPDVFGKPVRDKDFTVTVTGNNVVAKCSNTAMTSVLWEVNTGVQSTEKETTFYVPIKGDYKLVLSVSNGGDYISSDTIPFTIAATDVEYYNKGIWKALTGGAGTKKTWVLDVKEFVTTTIDDAGVSTSTSVFKSAYFHNALDFYGDAEAGGATDNVWGPWGGTSIYNWGGTPEVGEITFDALTGVCNFTLDGVTSTGSYTLKPFDRPADFCTISSKNNNNKGPISLWENMLTGKYSYLRALSDQMADLKLTSGLRFPMDKGRISNDANTTYPSQFLISDLENVTIIHASDSSLVVRVKRTYEGDKESKCWLLYNFIVKEYNYPTPTNYTHPVKSITTNDLVGTWKLASVPGNWIGWAEKNELNTWADGAAMNATFVSWSVANTTEKLATSQKVTLKFESNGNCTITDFKFNTTTLLEESTVYTSTYSVNNGYIVFGSDVNITGYTDMIALSGKNMYALTVTGSTNGLWIGKNNGDKTETTAIHIVKQ